MSDERRALAAPRSRNQILEAVSNSAGGFDIDFLHVIEARDDELIKNEILYGAGSSKFVYDFEVGGKPVSGISVIGARHLAHHYGAIKHRLVASVQKTGALFTFTSYPHDDTPMLVDAKRIPELDEEPDYFEAVVEVEDIKVGNTIQVQRREMKFEKKRDGSYFERPHYATIAQSKAYRNAVLNLLPQDVTLKWKENMLKLGKNETVTESVIDTKRHAVIQFAAQKALQLTREAVNGLTMEQIAGLADAAREGKLPAFTQAAVALGLLQAALTDETAGAHTTGTAGSGGGGTAGADPTKPRRGRGTAAATEKPTAGSGSDPGTGDGVGAGPKATVTGAAEGQKAVPERDGGDPGPGTAAGAGPQQEPAKPAAAEPGPKPAATGKAAVASKLF